MNTFLKSALGTSLAIAVAACGGGGGSNDAATTGQLNLAITDAPVDGASAVWVTITGMHIKRTDTGSERSVTLNGADTVNNELVVNLLDLTNGTSAALFANSVTSGEYQWIRFEVEDACITFINNPGTCEPLILPAQDQLKTAGSFTVPANGIANITVDWDLRKAIVQQGNGSYRLKPVLHLRENANVGAISGIIQGDDSVCADGEVAAVYFYSGIVTPDDMDDIGVEPFASVKVQQNLAENDSFYIGMLDPGTYTYAYTCDALLDAPETSQNIEFYGEETVEVQAGSVSDVVYAPVLIPI